MFDTLKQICENRQVCLLGFGREGQSSYLAIRKVLPEQELFIHDLNPAIESIPLVKEDQHLRFITGVSYLDGLGAYEVIMKSPGISWQKLSGIDSARVYTQSSLFTARYRKQMIGITGTKGKSTTSSLIHHITRQHTDDTVLAGNIGIPPFDLLEQIKEETIIVCELSSHQLERMSVSPSVAVILNLYEEHLDHYSSRDEYFRAKMNIARNQADSDYLIVHGDDDLLMKWVSRYPGKGKLITYGHNRNHCQVNSGDASVNADIPGIPACQISLEDQTALKGEHNLLNIMAAVTACLLRGISKGTIESGIRSFKPLPHRMEYIGNVEGVDFYNDSIATIPEASIAAMRSIPHVDTIILGGFDRGIDYTFLAEFLVKEGPRNIILMGTAGVRIHHILKLMIPEEDHRIFMVDSLGEAVLIAKKQTAPTKACLLSPAAASYDAYRDFAERGSAYKSLVLS